MNTVSSPGQRRVQGVYRVQREDRAGEAESNPEVPGRRPGRSGVATEA